MLVLFSNKRSLSSTAANLSFEYASLSVSYKSDIASSSYVVYVRLLISLRSSRHKAALLLNVDFASGKSKKWLIWFAD